MKRTLAFLALCALPIAASAQVGVPPPERFPAAATGSVQRNSNGITVSASATTNITATMAKITLWISTANNAMTLNETAVKPIVDAMVASGVDPSSIVQPANFAAPGYSNNASISATVKNPTDAMMKNGVVTVGSAVAKMSNVRINSVTVELINSDCAAALDAARSKAIAYARHKAQQVAKDVSVGLGPVINVNSGDQGSSYSVCRTQYNVGPGGPSFQMWGQDQPSDPYTTIPVFSSVTITFAIK